MKTAPVQQEERMKQPKKPTRRQKIIAASSGLDWHNWSVLEEDEEKLVLINKKSKRHRTVIK